MNENTTTAAQTVIEETQPEGKGVQSERTFTQEDVDRIVKKRLEKERARAEQSQQEQDDQAQKELMARENRLSCREFLLDNNYPKELIDCVDTSDPNEFKAKVETIYKVIGEREDKPRSAPPMYSTDRVPSGKSSHYGDLPEGFEYGAKHKPKQR